MMRQPHNILFLCQGNSSRSLMAEAILKRTGQGRFRAFSAGSQPRGQPDPETVALLQSRDHDVSALRSKSWDEFVPADAPKMHVIVALCDFSAGEICAEWPGEPRFTRWSIPDPASIPAGHPERRRRLEEIYAALEAHIRVFAGLWEKTLDPVPAENVPPGAAPRQTVPASKEGTTMASPIYNVLFVCTGNSARSILAESILNQWGRGRFRAFSAGSFPKGAVHPYALDLLQSLDMPTEGLRSKSWSEFAGPDAPELDFVFTVCDQAAGEACPVWPSQPITAHWGVPDPAAAEGSEIERRQAFREAFRILDRRIKLFVGLGFDKLDRLALSRRLAAIGNVEAAPPSAADTDVATLHDGKRVAP